jgi:hypothetical protein
LNNLTTIFIILLAFALGFLIAPFLMPEKETIIKEPFSGTIQIDTVFKTIEKEPIILEKIKTKIIKQKDTIIKTYPFIAKVDTILKRDTIKISYDFPQNIFSMNIRRMPDTLALQKMLITKMIKIEPPWWETPAFIAAGTLIGYVLASSLK